MAKLTITLEARGKTFREEIEFRNGAVAPVEEWEDITEALHDRLDNVIGRFYRMERKLVDLRRRKKFVTE